MKILRSICTVLPVLLLSSCMQRDALKVADECYADYVNPFIGTDFTGNTYPVHRFPSAWCNSVPTTGFPVGIRISGYFYPDSTIAGFSHTHLSGTGAGDLYDISFMPVTLPYKELKNRWASIPGSRMPMSPQAQVTIACS